MISAGRATELAELLRQEQLQIWALQATTERIRQVMQMIREDLAEEPTPLDATVLLPRAGSRSDAHHPVSATRLDQLTSGLSRVD